MTEPEDELGGVDVDVENLIDEDTDEDSADQVNEVTGEVRRKDGHLEKIREYVLEQVAAGPVDIDDLVAGYFGVRLSENNRRHARIRQAVARLAWPKDYGLPLPALVTVELPSDRNFGVVRMKGDAANHEINESPN